MARKNERLPEKWWRLKEPKSDEEKFYNMIIHSFGEKQAEVQCRACLKRIIVRYGDEIQDGEQLLALVAQDHDFECKSEHRETERP